MHTLGNVFEQSTDAVFGINTAGVIQFSNHSFEQLMGYSPQELHGSQCANVLRGTRLCGQEFCGPDCPIPKSVTGQSAISGFDLVVRRADGNSTAFHRDTHSSFECKISVKLKFVPFEPGQSCFM